MVLPTPDAIDRNMDAAKSQITLEMVVEFIQSAPPEFIDYLLEMLMQEEQKAAPPPDPALDTAMASVTPAAPMR